MLLFFFYFFIPRGNFQAHCEQKIIIYAYMFLVFLICVHHTHTLCASLIFFYGCAPFNKSHADNWLEFAIPSTQNPRLVVMSALSFIPNLSHACVSIINAGTVWVYRFHWKLHFSGIDISCHEMIVSVIIQTYLRSEKYRIPCKWEIERERERRVWLRTNKQLAVL